jgi:hypothetical protein
MGNQQYQEGTVPNWKPNPNAERVVAVPDQYGNYIVVSGSTSGSRGESISDVYKEKALAKSLEKEAEKAKREVSAEDLYNRVVAGKERPAETASRLVPVMGKEETPFQKLAAKRYEELMVQAGAERYAAHVPQVFTDVDGEKTAISTQVYPEQKSVAEIKKELGDKNGYGISSRGYNGYGDRIDVITRNIGLDNFRSNLDLQKNNFNLQSQINVYKPSMISSVYTYGQINKDTFLGALARTSYAYYTFGRGAISGYISFFNPKTYVTIVKSIKEGSFISSFGSLGEEFRQQPETFTETMGGFYGMGKGGKTLKIVSPKIVVEKFIIPTEVEKVGEF